MDEVYSLANAEAMAHHFFDGVQQGDSDKSELAMDCFKREISNLPKGCPAPSKRKFPYARALLTQLTKAAKHAGAS